MTEYVNYKTAPIGTVASDEFTTLVKNDKGWYWLEDNLQEDGGHVVPREVVHEFQLGEVVTPETLGWLPPGSEITPGRKDHAMVYEGQGGWTWADGLPGTTPGDLVARWVANTTYTLTKFTQEDGGHVVPREVVHEFQLASLEEMLGLDQSPEMLRAEFLVSGDRELLRRLVEVRKERGLSQAQVGDMMGVAQPTVAAFEAHDSNPQLSTIRRYAHAVRALIRHEVEADSGQLGDGRWQRMDTPTAKVHLASASFTLAVASSVFDQVDAGAAPFRDFGKVVELPNGRFLAVPNRPVREFETAQEAVEWLI